MAHFTWIHGVCVCVRARAQALSLVRQRIFSERHSISIFIDSSTHIGNIRTSHMVVAL